MRKSTHGTVEAKVEATPRLGMMIHEAVRKAIERAVDEELAAARGAKAYARTEERRGYRNGSRTRTLTGPTGKFEMNVFHAGRCSRRKATRSGDRKCCRGTRGGSSR